MDPRSTPAYTISEAARYVRVAPATLRSWVRGRPYPTSAGAAFWRPLIRLPDDSRPLLSFENLIEAHVLWGLRNNHAVPLKHVRIALEYAQRELGVDRLLLHEDMRTSAGDVFFLKYNEILNLSRSGQIALRKVVESHLKRVEWNDLAIPIRLYPFVSDQVNDADRAIMIDPAIHFGRPIVCRAGVSTAILADRIDNGEDISDLAEDYGLTVSEIESAIIFEKSA